MKYILYDNIEGTILGLSVDERIDLDNYWVTLSDEAYDEILKYNGQYRVLVDDAEQRINEYKALENNNDYCIVTIDTITKEIIYNIDEVINSVITKNYTYCNMFIENGINYTFPSGITKKYTYKLEDQINLNQIKMLVDNGVLNETTGVFIKASGESEFDNISVDEFKDLYNALLKHKQYQLCRLYQYNEYVKTLTDINEIQSLQYEMILPDEYIKNIDNYIANFENL